MIVTVTANAAVDRTLHVDRLVPGSLVTAREQRAQAGGKGVNVARVLHALKVPVTAVVLVGGEAGQWIVADLERAGIPVVPVRVPGESRSCHEIVASDGTVTQLHGRGVVGSEAIARALVSTCADLAGSAGWIACCGSLASGLPPDTAARVLAAGRRAGAATALDTRGAALAAGIAVGPDLLRVNRNELAEALDLTPERAPADARTANLSLGVVSAGDLPILAWTADGGRFRIEPPRVVLRNPIGCGDAMMAGLLAASSAGLSIERALRRATALAAADAESPCAGRTDVARAEALAERVRLERVP